MIITTAPARKGIKNDIMLFKAVKMKPFVKSRLVMIGQTGEIHSMAFISKQDTYLPWYSFQFAVGGLQLAHKPFFAKKDVISAGQRRWQGEPLQKNALRVLETLIQKYLPQLFKYLPKNLSFAALKQEQFIRHYFIYKFF